MNPDNIWLLASTFSKCYQYHWRYPIHFKLSDRYVHHMKRNSWRSTICKSVVRSCIFCTAFSTLAILILVSVSKVKRLETKRIIICAFGLVCYIVGFISYYNLSGKMETVANVMNALVQEYDKVRKGLSQGVLLLAELCF